jgi:hypothetical protein
MTPQRRNTSQLGLNLAGDSNLHLTGLHLTDDQMNGLLASPAESDPTAESHLQTCAACAEELAGLREALSLFQQASIAHANHELARLRSLDRPGRPVLPTHRPYSQTLFWVTASTVLMAAIVPIEMHWQRNLSNPAGAATVTSTHAADSESESESDEALLEDVNRDLSRSVPASMQALDNPTGTTGSASATSSETLTQSTAQTSTQRKD